MATMRLACLLAQLLEARKPCVHACSCIHVALSIKEHLLIPKRILSTSLQIMGSTIAGVRRCMACAAVIPVQDFVHSR